MQVAPRAVWGSLFAVGSVYEWWAVTNEAEGDTLSEVIRDVCHVDRATGKAAFLGAYLGFSAWFVPHIVAKAVEKAQEFS